MTNPHCTISELFHSLSGKWILPVLYQLQREEGPRRFGELRKAIGSITTSELTKSLRHLETLGLAHREQFNEIPPRVEYRLTELGVSLQAPLEQIASWLVTHQEVVQPLIYPKKTSAKDA